VVIVGEIRNLHGDEKMLFQVETIVNDVRVRNFARDSDNEPYTILHKDLENKTSTALWKHLIRQVLAELC
jgi:hypothetical protein